MKMQKWLSPHHVHEVKVWCTVMEPLQCYYIPSHGENKQFTVTTPSDNIINLLVPEDINLQFIYYHY